MRFEESPDENFPQRIIMVGEEVLAVGAAYRELVFRLTSEGKPEQITEFHLGVSQWKQIEDDGEKWIDTQVPEQLAGVLEDFHARTRESILEIPLISKEAPFNSLEIPVRVQLGNVALRLAGDIKDGIHMRDVLNEVGSEANASIEAEGMAEDRAAAEEQ